MMAIVKTIKISVGENGRNWNPCTFLVGMLNGAATMEDGRKGLQTLKIKLPYDPECPPLGIQKSLKQNTQTSICTHMFIATFFTISTRWRPPKCPLS